MNIRFLETFVWLSRLQNFRTTAEKLNTTQPAVSGRIAALEDLLHTKLYIRENNKFELTLMGRRILSHAEKIMELRNEMHNIVLDDKEFSGIVRIGVIEMVAMSWLPDLVRQVRSCTNNIIFDFSTDTSRALLNSLKKDEIDIALILGPVNEPNIVNDSLCTYSNAWLSSSDHGDFAEEIDVVDLSRMPIIMTRKDASGYSIIKEYFATYGIQNISIPFDNVTLNCAYSVETARQLIKSGLGVMAMPTLIMADAIADGSVKVVPVKQKLPPAYLMACYKNTYTPQLLNKVLKNIREVVEEYAHHCNPDYFHV